MGLLIAIFISTIISGYISYSDIENNSRKYKLRRAAVVIFSFVTILVSLFQYLESEQEKNKVEAERVKADEKTNQILKLNAELISTQKRNKKESDSLNYIIIHLNEKVSGKTESLLSITEKYSNEQKKFIDYNIGADVPYIKLRPIKPNFFTIDIQNPSKNPIYDAQAILLDFDEMLNICNPKIDQKVTMSARCYDGLIKFWDIGTLSGKQWIVYDKKIIADENLHRYQMQFRTTNKAYISYFFVKIIDNYFYWTMRLYQHDYKTGHKTLIHEHQAGLKFSDKYWIDSFYTNKEFVLTEN